jgi:hypothetical protein
MKPKNILNAFPYKQALVAALDWSQTKPYTPSKGAAQVYIQAMSLAELEGEQLYGNPAKGRSLQILYILNNLRGWRGQEARQSKKALNEQYDRDTRII